MNMEKRREQMVALINREGSVSFNRLKEAFQNVSEMTLRRDLEFLDRAKRIIRTHGGARSVDILVGTDDLFLKRSTRNAGEKKLVAEKALSLLHENTTVYIDSGSTCTEFARVLSDGPYMIFTGSISCALEMARLQQAQVHIVGGVLNAASLCMNGVSTMRMLENINFQTVFLGVTGYHSGRGFTCGSAEESELKRLLIRRAEKVVLLMDSQKVGVTSTFTFAAPEDVDVLVTDGDMDEKTRREFERAGVVVL